MPTGTAPPLPGPPNTPTGDPAAKLHFWIRDYRGQNLSLGTKYPLSGALLRAGRPAGGDGHTHPWGAPLSLVEPRSQSRGLGPASPLEQQGSPRRFLVFPEQASRPHAPQTLSYQTPPGRVEVPLAGCAGAARAESKLARSQHCERPLCLHRPRSAQWISRGSPGKVLREIAWGEGYGQEE